jgi:hypothetical protein
MAIALMPNDPDDDEPCPATRRGRALTGLPVGTSIDLFSTMAKSTTRVTYPHTMEATA